MTKFDNGKHDFAFMETVFWPQSKSKRVLNAPPAEGPALKVQRISNGLDTLLDSQASLGSVLALTPPHDDASPPHPDDVSAPTTSPLCRSLPHVSPSPQTNKFPAPPEDTHPPAVLHSTTAVSTRTSRVRAIKSLTEDLLLQISQISKDLGLADTQRQRIIVPIKRALTRLHKFVEVTLNPKP